MSTMTAPRTRTQARTRVYMKVKSGILAGAIMGSGLTHKQLAKEAKLGSSGTVSNLASGYRKTCSPATAKAISEALGVPISKLFTTVVS